MLQRVVMKRSAGKCCSIGTDIITCRNICRSLLYRCVNSVSNIVMILKASAVEAECGRIFYAFGADCGVAGGGGWDFWSGESGGGTRQFAYRLLRVYRHLLGDRGG